MPIWLAILLIVLAAIVSGVACFMSGVNHRKKIAEAEIGSAEAESKRIVEDAVKDAEAKKKEIVLEGKDEVHQFRNETEKELNARRKEVQRQERRVQQKEETLDRKTDNLEKKEENVAKKLKQAEERLAEAESIKKSEFEVLEKISGFTTEQAKEYLLKNLEAELVHEKAVRILDYEQQLREEAEKKARNIISLAIMCKYKDGTKAQRKIVKCYNYDIENDKLLSIEDIIEYKKLCLKQEVVFYYLWILFIVLV